MTIHFPTRQTTPLTFGGITSHPLKAPLNHSPVDEMFTPVGERLAHAIWLTCLFEVLETARSQGERAVGSIAYDPNAHTFSLQIGRPNTPETPQERAWFDNVRALQRTHILKNSPRLAAAELEKRLFTSA